MDNPKYGYEPGSPTEDGSEALRLKQEQTAECLCEGNQVCEVCQPELVEKHDAQLYHTR